MKKPTKPAAASLKKKRRRKSRRQEIRSRMHITFTMLMLAVIALVTATYAWFTLSLSVKVESMRLNVSAGSDLRISEEYHTLFEDYVKVLTEADIDRQLIANTPSRIFADYRLDPMTSANGRELYIQNDNTPISADSGFYIEFILYFAGTGPMKVYLTEDESDTGLDDGTAVKVGDPTIKNTGWEYVINSVRISFEPFDDSHGNSHIAGEPDAKIYEPNKNDTTTLAYPSGLGGGTQNTLSSPPVINTGRDPEAALFELTTANNWRAAVRVRIWIEGNDPDCVNLDTKSIEESQFLTQLRFEGVDTP